MNKFFGWLKERRSRRLKEIEDQIAARISHDTKEIGDEIAARISHDIKEIEDQIAARMSHDIDAALIRVATQFAPVERARQYLHGLRAMGFLNYEDYWISGEYRFLTLYLDRFPNALVFDVGAHRGEYSALVTKIAPGATVHAFEPHPTSFTVLDAAARSLGFHAHQLAFGQEPGSVDLYDRGDTDGSQHASLYREVIEKIHKQPSVCHKVRCDTVDRVAEQLGCDRIGLLKVDTEAHELAVLKGARSLIEEGRIDVIQFEFNEMNVVSRTYFKDFYEFLPNYKFYRLLSHDAVHFAEYSPVFMEVFAFQNIVCIRRDIESHWIVGASPFLS